MSGASWIGRRSIAAFSKSGFSCRLFSSSSSKNMKFVQFSYNDKPGETRAGYVEGEGVVDINKSDPSLGTRFLDILRNNDLDKVKKLKSTKPSTIPLSSVRLAAPLTGMDKVICVGLNYRDHCEEQNIPIPKLPMFFSKFSSTVIGPNDSVKLRTGITQQVDWEVELVVVIGKQASNVKAAKAFDYVVGYTIAQDISSRDWQKEKNSKQFLLGKSMDTFCPTGPWIVTSDEVGDPQNLNIQCSLNNTLKQKSNTGQLINKIPDIIERLSSVMTLLPGDIILTGTPGGVGMFRKPPEYLKPGDVLVSEIENIGSLTTKMEEF